MEKLFFLVKMFIIVLGSGIFFFLYYFEYELVLIDLCLVVFNNIFWLFLCMYMCMLR